MNANDPNAENRVDEVEFLRQRIKMLETELNDIRLHSAHQKQKLDELEARLRGRGSESASMFMHQRAILILDQS